MSDEMPQDYAHRPVRVTRAATYAWNGKVYEIDLATKQMNCPNCGLRFFLPHTLIEEGDHLATVSPSVVCPPEHGGCGWHVVIQRGNAI